ncbi:transducin/WD40 repeat-like superfamily protein isoform X2 [Tasmannia lanceolata]|uniref:transducin/WD40 repeat-like superfamily protein isoform X2 n=1 Tax=Tasmannia lanceolata TaxID=3420 RepID=UPI0040636E4D
MEEALIEEGENSREMEVAPALIAVHPLGKSIAVAAGSELRVFDLQGDCSISLLDDSGGPSHTDAIRAIGFGAKGTLFASAGDDKLVKIWITNTWRCVRTVCSEKRVSAVAISHDGLFLTFADKFGVVWVVCLDVGNESHDLVHKKPVPILAHYCSIITSLEFSPDGRFLATADRDFKIRVTLFPKKPLNGAHEIQSFCLGHTDFVSCLAFLCTPDYPLGLLLSGSGDSTVRLWDFISGHLLDTCEVGAKAELVESNGEEECYPAVTDLCASPDGSLVFVAIQSLHGVMLLTCDFSAKTLSIAKIVSMRESFIPTCLGMSCFAQQLWMVTGASNIPALGSLPLARVKVISGFRKGTPNSSGLEEPVVLEDDAIPGGEHLLERLQGSKTVENDEKALAVAAEAVKIAMRNLLIKRQYSVEKRELRKKCRNDRKLKH